MGRVVTAQGTKGEKTIGDMEKAKQLFQPLKVKSNSNRLYEVQRRQVVWSGLEWVRV